MDSPARIDGDDTQALGNDSMTDLINFTAAIDYDIGTGQLGTSLKGTLICESDNLKINTV